MGKTHQVHLVPLLAQKHPHGRGEDKMIDDVLIDDAETPPRAWGRLNFNHRHDGLTRNTPTGVGKTMVPKNARYQQKKHPHGRGEDV